MIEEVHDEEHSGCSVPCRASKAESVTVCISTVVTSDTSYGSGVMIIATMKGYEAYSPAMTSQLRRLR